MRIAPHRIRGILTKLISTKACQQGGSTPARIALPGILFGSSSIPSRHATAALVVVADAFIIVSHTGAREVHLQHPPGSRATAYELTKLQRAR